MLFESIIPHPLHYTQGIPALYQNQLRVHEINKTFKNQESRFELHALIYSLNYFQDPTPFRIDPVIKPISPNPAEGGGTSTVLRTNKRTEKIHFTL